MAHQRLLELFEEFNPQQVERIFGREVNLAPIPQGERAPIKRVALFTEAFLPKVDGVSKTAYLALKYLKATGREVLIFAPDIAPKTIEGSRVIPLPSLGVPRVPETRLALPVRRIASELEAFKPDMIHLFSPALMCVSGMASGRFMNVPVIANFQTDLPGYAEVYQPGVLGKVGSNLLHNWLRYLHNGCHLTLAPTQHTINQLQAQGYKRLRAWGRGVDSVRFSPAHATAEWRARLLNGRDPKSLLCVYVGRLATEKRIDLLIEAARTPGIALTIIGDGAQREPLEALFAGTDTHFTGYLFGDDLPAAFASADVFMFTGPNETFGQVVQEAMASALPSIVINQGGVQDLVLEGETGFVVPPEPESFALAVRILRDQPDLRHNMANRAREIAESRPWERVLGELEGHYQEAYDMNRRFVQVFNKTDYHALHNLYKVLYAPRSVTQTARRGSPNRQWQWG